MHTFAQRSKAADNGISVKTASPAWTRFKHPHVASILHSEETTPQAQYSSALSPIQTKLKISAAGDQYEQEADKVANQVVNMPQQECCSCKSAEANAIEDKEQAPVKIGSVLGYNLGETVAPPKVNEVLLAPGQAMDSATRAYFEPRFAQDFSGVRIHTDKTAQESAKAINALAYTSGNHIVLGANQPSFTSHTGKKLLAHELTHVVQQSATTSNVIQKLSDPDCGSTRSLPLSGACRRGFVHTCYSETVVPTTSAALNITVEVDYQSPPGPIVAGKEDFSVQVYKCRSFWSDQRIGSKRISTTLPDTLTFSIASVTPNDKYYIKIYSRSHLNLIGSYTLSQ